MSLCKHHFVVLLSLVSLFVAGTLIFTSGFLLNRAVVNLTSECHADFILQSERHGEEGCWMHKRFSRAVILVIDALRYDFMLTNLSSTRENEFFHNKLPVFEELLQRKPLNSRLYKFLADPPTTTLQRLKGLTTGSLPTFVDAGSNFGSDEIKEDNLIHQLYSLDKPIVFLGDDTWDGLFPDKFLRSAFFPSFNVMDLHTVDNGILEHLDPELKKTDWDVLIMHFLGVDHCGHRFGPYNPEMAKKLHQMDKMLRSVIQDLRDDTVLMVLGDHGMTRTGDHGGDSDSELEAGLFIYSPAQITATPLPSDPTHYKTVSQIDLVPTLALLLGIPVPFSNLGMVMTDLFNHCPWSKTQNSKIKQIFHSLKALRLNAYQVHAYLEAYRKISDDFPKEKLDHLQALFRHSESDLQHLLTSMVNNDESNAERNMEILQGHYVTYISEVKELCQKMWAKFNMPSIYLGLVIILFALTLTFLVLLGTQKKKDLYWLSFGCIGSCLLLAGIGVLQHFVAFELPQLSMTVVLGFFDVLVFVLVAFGIWRVSKQQKNTGKKENEPELKTKSLPDVDVLIAILLCMVSFAGYFSNSYVVYEDAVVTFSAQTVILVLGYRVIKDILRSEFMSDLAEREKTGRQKRTNRFDVMKLLTHPASIAAAVVAVLLICVRFSSIFRACREEQVNCEISTLFIPLSESPVKNIRYFTGIGCLAGYVTAARLWLRHFGNLNGQSLPVLCARYALPLAAIFIGMHWAVLSLPTEILDGLPTWQSTVLPQLVYILLLICVATVIFSPLCIFMLPVDSKEELTVQPGLTHLQMIPSLFNRVKLNWGKQVGNGGSAPKPPVVYGLGTVYSASVVFLLSVLSLLASLLLADGISPVIFILLLTQCLYLELSSAFLRSQSSAFLSGHLLPVLGWLILSSVFFYDSGHQATITTIRWEAAFIGFRGHHTTNVLPAMLIGMNIFCSQILFLVASPLLLFSQKVSLKLFHIFSKTKSEGAMSEDKGEFCLHEEPDSLRTGMFKLCLLIFFLQGLKLFGSMCAAALHRRHLMVWKIFAPRFVYEGVVSFIVFGACCLMYLFVLRVDAVLAQWVQKLTNQSESRKGV